MEYKIVYRFLENQKIKHVEVESDYVLQDREVFSIGSFYVPIWENGVVESATKEEIEQYKKTALDCLTE